MKHVSWLQLTDNHSFLMLSCLDSLDCVMKMRIEFFAHRSDAHKTLFRQGLPQLAPDQLETFSILEISWIWRFGQGAIQCIENRKKVLDQRLDAAMAILVALFFDAFAIILKVRLTPDQRLRQLLLFDLELLHLLGECCSLGAIPSGAFWRVEGRTTRWRVCIHRCLLLLSMTMRRHAIRFLPGNSIPGLVFRKELSHKRHGRNYALIMHAHGSHNAESSLRLIA